MPLTVLEAIQIGELKKMTLVAGRKGMTNIISSVGILDHEIVESNANLFHEGDFVLSTFTAARNNQALLFQSIRDLIDCGAAGLAIKKVYYKELPGEIIDYANKNNFPIFFYDRETYTEDIIRDLSFGIQSRSNLELLSSKIDLLYKNDYSRLINERIAREINPYFLNEYVVFNLKEKYYVSDEQLVGIIERYNKSDNSSNYNILIKYNDGLILILSYKSITDRDIKIDFEHILNQYGIDINQYYIGKSNIGKDLGMLDTHIKESIFAAQACELMTRDATDFGTSGIYKFLLPHINDKWLKNFTASILEPIISYDDGKLIETARLYIKNKCDVIATASQLYQHKNTIRYRIRTMQQLTGIDNIYDFNEQLSIAVKFEELIK